MCPKNIYKKKQEKKQKLPKVTVITLNFNGKHFLKKHYQSLLRQTYPNFKLHLTENGSNDGSEFYVKKNFPQVKINKIAENLGPVKGYNTGGFSVNDDSKYIVFVGNDTWFDKDWLKELVEVAESDPKIAICGSRQMNYEGGIEINLGGIGLDIFGYPCGAKNKRRDYFYADGVSLLVRKKIFRQLKGFDERYFVFAEEADLAWRARLLGYKIAIAPKSVFYHAIGGTLGVAALDKKLAGSKDRYKLNTKKRFFAEKNALCTLLKNYSCISLLLILPVFFLLNLLEALFFLLAGHPKAALVYPRSWRWNLRNLKETRNKRRHIQGTRVVPDRIILASMLKVYGKLRAVRIIGMPTVE